jgi:cytochrome P450
MTGSVDWHEISLKQTFRGIVGRLSSRIFLGPELCRDPKWLKIIVDYTVSVFQAGGTLRLWPRFLLPIVHWYIPECQNARMWLQETRQIIQPVIERRAERASAAHGREAAPEYSDFLAWLEEAANGRTYDAGAGALLLSVASIHTTSDLLTQTIYDLCQHRDLIEPLREEAKSALAAGGWEKPEVSKLKLMDSVLKESQRLKSSLGSFSFILPWCLSRLWVNFCIDFYFPLYDRGQLSSGLTEAYLY